MDSSKGSSPYVADPGPGFDPEAQPPAELAAAADVPESSEAFEVKWEEEQIRGWLLNVGGVGHQAFGIAEHDWEMTEQDLERIAPPLTRIANRYDVSRAAAAYSDPAAVAIGFGMYGWRSAVERVQAKRAAEEAEQNATATAEPRITPPAPAAAAPRPPAGETDPYFAAAEELRRANEKETP